MWTDRNVVYYSREKNYAVRWRSWGQDDTEADYVKFDNKVEAERLFNALIEQHRAGHLPDGPVEIFVSQAKWVRYRDVDHDRSGVVKYEQAGKRSAQCRAGDHEACIGQLAECCTCPHHLGSQS